MSHPISRTLAESEFIGEVPDSFKYTANRAAAVTTMAGTAAHRRHVLRSLARSPAGEVCAAVRCIGL
jgi:hypothetical protein